MTPIKTITMYQTSDGRTFHGESCAISHQQDIDAAEKANQLLSEGRSIGEILQDAGRAVPDDILFKVTKDSKLVISYWQCRDTPGYQPCRFRPGWEIYVFGNAGSWSGPYGNDMPLSDLVRYAKDPGSILKPEPPKGEA